jgi:hypothetical protein
MVSGEHLAAGTSRGKKASGERIGWGQAFLQCFLPGSKSRDGQKNRKKLERWPHNLCTVAVIIILLIPWFPFVKFYLASNAGQEVVVTLFHTCWDDAGDQKYSSYDDFHACFYNCLKPSSSQMCVELHYTVDAPFHGGGTTIRNNADYGELVVSSVR